MASEDLALEDLASEASTAVSTGWAVSTDWAVSTGWAVSMGWPASMDWAASMDIHFSKQQQSLFVMDSRSLVNN